MTSKVTILNASKKFNPVLPLLESKAQDALNKIGKHIRLPNIDIIISPWPKEHVTTTGILGCVSTQYLIDILLDTERDDLLDIINNELPLVLAHELHHVVRTYSGVQEEKLLQVLISEGLACHFEMMFIEKNTISFFSEIKKYNWIDLYKQMDDYLDNTDFNYPLFFGGEDTSKFPNRAGYWVGYNLVSQYINKYGGCAATLVNIPAEKILLAHS
ncbi:DUF2268 domain-containing putative Zn-dependent protease [Litorilituus sediminis]|uniref:DUF2268 domain-containing protein n=1 Tax=Litorilituus sediminis TaxID=718192 RepID=A0A4P6P6J2_9GAMM|nr:DUF2268 domain-containing putative Zn-dependent protease [Litorilituus sediminis]QBG34995.1 hypothetical protein EMK97_04215 [Litorilituus sediminis]